MNARLKAALLSAMCFCIVLLTASACQNSLSPERGGGPAPRKGAPPSASVSGTVTYRERIALSPGATLEVQLRDVSLQDTSSILIAEQVIANPGQVPVRFKVKYNRDDLVQRNTYSITARIKESDGRLAFTNDTAYEVITRGNPNKVDMVLVMVEPPPDPSGDGVASSSGRPRWVEVPVPVVGAKLIQDDTEHLLLVAFYQSTIDGCSRPGGHEFELDGTDIIVNVTLMAPPPSPWAIPCLGDLLEVETVVRIGSAFAPGQTYRVVVNGQETTTFTPLKPEFPDSFIALSPIEKVEIVALEKAPLQYELRVVSGLPKGSGCSRFNGYEVRRSEPEKIDVSLTHHEVADPFVTCTADYPTLETSIPLGSDFEPGKEYTVRVNSDATQRFLAR